jgi:hypothetical protein
MTRSQSNAKPASSKREFKRNAAVSLPGLRGLTAHPTGEDEIVLIFDDGLNRERFTMSALELAEAIARLEEPGETLMRADGLEAALDDEDNPADDQDDLSDDDTWHLETQRMPRLAHDSSGEYVVVPVSLNEPSGMMYMRRVIMNGPDTLEFATPSGSLYELDYQVVLPYLRPMLPY